MKRLMKEKSRGQRRTLQSVIEPGSAIPPGSDFGAKLPHLAVCQLPGKTTCLVLAMYVFAIPLFHESTIG